MTALEIHRCMEGERSGSCDCEGCFRVTARVVSIGHGIFCIVSLAVWIIFLVTLFEESDLEENGLLRSLRLEAKNLDMVLLIICLLLVVVEISADVSLFVATSREHIMNANERRKCGVKALIWLAVALTRILISAIQVSLTDLQGIYGIIYWLPIGLNVLCMIFVILFVFEVAMAPGGEAPERTAVDNWLLDH